MTRVFIDTSFLLALTAEDDEAALTHDHHFEQAGFEALLRRDPRLKLQFPQVHIGKNVT